MKSNFQRREQAKEALLYQLYKLIQAIEEDNNSSGPIWIAQEIAREVRDYFNYNIWKETPVCHSLFTHLQPLKGETITIRIQTWQPAQGGEGNAQWFVGKLGEMWAMSAPDDGIFFYLTAPRKRKASRYQYKASKESHLQVWQGNLSPQYAQQTPPLYEHAGEKVNTKPAPPSFANHKPLALPLRAS